MQRVIKLEIIQIGLLIALHEPHLLAELQPQLLLVLSQLPPGLPKRLHTDMDIPVLPVAD